MRKRKAQFAGTRARQYSRRAFVIQKEFLWFPGFVNPGDIAPCNYRGPIEPDFRLSGRESSSFHWIQAENLIPFRSTLKLHVRFNPFTNSIRTALNQLHRFVFHCFPRRFSLPRVASSEAHSLSNRITRVGWLDTNLRGHSITWHSLATGYPV